MALGTAIQHSILYYRSSLTLLAGTNGLAPLVDFHMVSCRRQQGPLDKYSRHYILYT